MQEPSGGHTRNGISSETPYRLCGGQIVTMDDEAHYIDAWDLLIAHPPCTYLQTPEHDICGKGHQLQEDRVMKGLFMRFWWADIPRICVENPVPSRVFFVSQSTRRLFSRTSLDTHTASNLSMVEKS